MLATLGGGIILAVLLPFAATAILYGFLGSARGKGAKVLILAVVFTAVIAAGGWFMWKWGVNTSLTISNLEAFPDGMRASVQMLLLISIPLALLSFLVQWVRSSLNGRRR